MRNAFFLATLGATASLLGCGSSKSTGSPADAGGSDELPPAMLGSHGPPGGPGCGLPSAAFCETFDTPSTHKGRAGELDSTLWAAGRLDPQLATANGVAFGIGLATIPPCRSDTPAQAYPDQDTLICDENADIGSTHLLVAAAAQNYGENSYRIRRPFDFTNRTGTIVFDAQAYMVQLLGWISLDVTEDPIDAPGFAIGGPMVSNNEGTIIPRNGFEIQFENDCAGYAPMPSFSVLNVQVFNNYVDKVFTQTPPTCLPTQDGKLSHFEVSVSQTRVEVRATPPSSDGVHFDPVQLIFAADVAIPFTRGYVSITTHNHATIKYSPNHSMDAWVARWDNVAFDGFVISNWREYEVADALTPGMNADDRAGPCVSVGYRLADVSAGPAQTLHIPGVDLTGVTAARLSLSAYYLANGMMPVSDFVLKYRFNGGAWRDRPLTAAEVGVLTGGNSEWTLGQIIDVQLSDLVAGDNTLEFVTSQVPQNYPPAVANIDLVLTTQ
jgi:hypothetical protein